MSDRTITPEVVQALLDKLGDTSFLSWEHHELGDGAGSMRYCILAHPDQDDRNTRKVGEDDAPAEREPWQRDNLVLAIGPDLARVMWGAERGELAPLQVTLWFDRVHRQYHLGPRCPRQGKTGRPAWADFASKTGRPFDPHGLLEA